MPTLKHPSRARWRTHPTLQPASAGTLRRAAIATIYAVVFCGLLPALLLATGRRLDALIPVKLPASTLLLALGAVIALAGFAISAASGVRLWREGNGLPISHLPPSRFVATGLYRRFRHPIYVGFTGFVAGLGLLIGSFWTLGASVPLLVAGWVAYARFIEEPVLVARFGISYEVYRKRVGVFGFRLPHSAIAARIRRGFYAAVNRVAAWTVLVRCGRLILVTYGLFVGMGTLLALAYLAVVLTSHAWLPAEIATYVVAIGILSPTFAKAFWLIGHGHRVRGGLATRIRTVGFVSWGALAGLLAASALVHVLFGYHYWLITDALMASVPLAYAVGRIGCLTYGCCYGREHDGLGVVYDCSEAKAVRERRRTGVPRYPTQLVSALHGALLFTLLVALSWTSPPAGIVTAVCLLAYGLGRFAEEFTRDRPRRLLSRFTAGQAGALVAMVAGWGLLFGIDAGGPAFGPVSAAAVVDSLAVGPLVVATALLVFLTTSIHWKRVGTW